jgi:hypothetical protein
VERQAGQGEQLVQLQMFGGEASWSGEQLMQLQMFSLYFKNLVLYNPWVSAVSLKKFSF